MESKRNDPCPCGSGQKYKKCCFKKSEKQFPAQSDEALKIRADAFKAMSGKNWNDAINLFKSLIETDLDHSEIYQAIASCYEGLEEYLTACEFYEKAISVASKDKLANLYYHLGIARACSQKTAKAIDAFQHFLELIENENAKKHANDILRMLGKIQEGNLNPTFFFVQVQLQKAFSEMDEELYDDASARMERLLSDDSANPDIYYNLGVAYTFLDKIDRALENFQKCVNIFPDYIKAWYNIGQISLIKLKDFSRALNCFDRVISIDPRYVAGHHQRAVVLEILKDYESALKSWQKTLELDTKNKAAADAIKRLSANH
jgi:tetratricopeptide (TPR) repeat protein